MNIAGVIVNALPGASRGVQQRLVLLPGVEVHAVSEQGRMVVTIESANERAVADLVTAMHALEGVLSASMVYHSFNEVMDETEGSL